MDSGIKHILPVIYVADTERLTAFFKEMMNFSLFI